MELGRTLLFINACVVISLTVSAPLAASSLQSIEAKQDNIVPHRNFTPPNQSIESDTNPTITLESKSIDEPTPKAVAPVGSVIPRLPIWNLLALTDITKPTLLEKAYLDALTILREDNSCSQFFGGASAINPLNELVRRLTLTHFDRSIAIRMSGPTITGLDNVTGQRFRLFEKAELNLEGSFFRGNTSLYEAKTPPVGEFQPNTREARAAILLHELGHVLRKADKTWILPDDGRDESVSRNNTRIVINACREQIVSLSNLSFQHELTAARAIVSPPDTTTVEIAQR